MAPSPSVDHQTVAFEVGRRVGNALEGHPCRVLVAPVDVLLPHGREADEEVDTVVQPDVLEGLAVRWEPIVARLLGGAG